ncbi:MAG TPA: SPOR domain-containing protein [Thermoanaerobaculia bacterium]|nr:SPOR domain-containing protein [Thermoanaerobaculia bacterium]
MRPIVDPGVSLVWSAAALLATLLLTLTASAAEPITLQVHESRTVQILGTTAAWAIDANVVDAAAVNGSVTLFGRSPGRTKVMVVSMTGENALDVVVAAKPRTAASSTAKRANQTTAEARYSSATREVQNNVSMTRETKNGRTEAYVRSVHQTRANGDRAATSIPSASYRIFTKERELTLLDRDVLHSPLTFSGTPVRGIHYLDDHWRIHAGVTAYATYQSFLVPVARETVAGAAYAFRTGAHSTLTPGVFVQRGEGSVLSLLYDYAPGEEAALRAELAFSNGLGGALQLRYDTQRDRAWADLRYRPRGFAVLGSGNTPGFQAETNWSRAYGRGSNAAVAFTSAELPSLDERVLAASADVDHRLNERVSLTGGASYGSFNRTHTLTIPAGVRLDFARGSVGSLYRYTRSSTNHGGHGGRLFARASLGRFYASAYADRQENAPTLEVIFSEQPELALALHELGIAATSPSDIARALREHAELAELGFIEGVTVDLAPARTQGGLELAWLSASAARHQLRARLLHSVTESVAARNETTIATLTYARRITESTDVFAGYTWWRSERRGQDAIVRPYVEVGVRQRFDGAPSFGGSGSITGIVFADEDLDGKSDGSGVAAEVELDGVQRQQTAPDGTFAFKGVTRGTHRLVARTPKPEAYFTTPSRVEVTTGEHVAFGVATTPARLLGRVTNDAGAGIAGVRVLLTRGPRQVVATTDSEGELHAATAPGEWEVSILTDSVPAGHSLAGSEPRSVVLDRTAPRRMEWQLRALRSISGRGAPANAELQVAPSGKRIRTDAEGKFSLRSLPPGEVTIIAGKTRRSVFVPGGPASLTVDFAETAAAAPEIRTVVTGERRDTMRGYVVLLGAFRIRKNAVDTQSRAKKNGIEAELAPSGALTIVRTPPFTSKNEADAAATKLARNGIEAVVVSTK